MHILTVKKMQMQNNASLNAFSNVPTMKNKRKSVDSYLSQETITLQQIPTITLQQIPIVS